MAITLGRPSDFKEEYCDLLLELSREGKSFAAFCAQIVISRQTMYNWMEKHPTFMDTVEASKQLRQSYWEEHFTSKALGENSSRNKSESAMMFILRSQFRDDYAEKIEVEQNSEININITNDDAAL